MKKILAFLLVLFTLNKSMVYAYAFLPNQTVINSGLDYLRSEQQSDGHIDGFDGVSDWAAMAFLANGIDINTVASGSGQTVEQYLLNTPPDTSSSSTDWSRRILAVTAANQNPYNFGGINLVSGLESYYNNNQIGDTSADNDDMFGLLALLASNVSTQSAIITDATSFILSHQHQDGGFSYATDPTIGSDIDDTAAAIMAMHAAEKANVSNTNLQTAIDNALGYILSHQNSDGGFPYDPNPQTSYDTTSNVSTTSWVAMAFSALSMQDDSHFVSAQNYLLSTQQSDGSFPYQPAYPPGDTFDTSYALLALVGTFWPQQIFQGVVPSDDPSVTLTPTPTEPEQIAATASDTSSTPTPTAEVTDTPTPTPTISTQPDPNPTSQPTTPTVMPSSQNAKVLGIATKKSVKSLDNNTNTLLARIFLSLGSVFLIVYLGQMIYNYRRRKERC